MVNPKNEAQDSDKGSRGDNPTKDGLAQQAPPGEVSHGGSEGEVLYGYGRQGGSIADTGTRTDVPVGIEQIESSKAYKVSPEGAMERQGDPPPRTTGNDRGVAGPTEDDVAASEAVVRSSGTTASST